MLHNVAYRYLKLLTIARYTRYYQIQIYPQLRPPRRIHEQFLAKTRRQIVTDFGYEQADDYQRADYRY